MKLIRRPGVTSEIWQIFIQDSSSTTGAGLTGLVFNSGGLTAYYHRDNDTTATAITLATMTVGTFTSSGFKEIDAANMPGWYQFCPPNAALAAGAKSCAIHLKGATNMAPVPIEVDLASSGVLLDSTGLDLIKPADPSAVPVAGTATIVQWIGWFGAWSVNKVQDTSSQALLRNTADSGNIGTYALSDDGTTFVSGAAS